MKQTAPPWFLCEPVITETLFLSGRDGRLMIENGLQRGHLVVAFDLGAEFQSVFALMEKYRDVPMSLADACLVRMSEILSDPVLLTTDSDFRVYRRNNRRVVPCLYPSDFSKTRPRRRR